MKIVLFITTLIYAIGLTAQEPWMSVSVNTKGGHPREIYPIVNEENGHTAIFFRNRNYIKATLFNKNRQSINKPFYAVRLPKNFDLFLNHAYNGDVYTLFFSNKSGKKYGNVKFDFKNHLFSIIHDLKLKPKREDIIETFSDKEKLYFLGVKKHSSICNFYVFDLNGKFTTKKIDLSNIDFSKHQGSSVHLSDFLMSPYGEKLIKKIAYNEPNALETVAAYNKIFYHNKKITILNNFYDEFTYVTEIDLTDGSYHHRKIVHKDFDSGSFKRGANSNIYGDYIFTVTSTPNRLNLDIFDKNSMGTIKSFEILKDSEISFKNTPIIVEGGEFDKYRELEKTSKFLRKISNRNLGIAVYEHQNKYVVTLGSSVETVSGVGPGIAAGVGGVLGGAIGGAISGLIFSSFDSYANTKSTRITCLFDKNFEHIKGEIPQNGFDKIKTFTETEKLDKKPVQTIFRYKGDYIWGYYDRSADSYQLYLFES